MMMHGPTNIKAFCCRMYVCALVMAVIVLVHIVVVIAWLASILNYEVLILKGYNAVFSQHNYDFTMELNTL